MDKRQRLISVLSAIHVAVVILCAAQNYPPLAFSAWYVAAVTFTGIMAVIERKSIVDGVLTIALSALFIWVGYELEVAQAHNDNMASMVMMFPVSMIVLLAMMYFTIGTNDRKSLLRTLFTPWKIKT